ncbi:hypothetical protein RB653_003254 [Dictyostelium firmibasis]|uniref:peptidyl-tRNA hydrolase n=1 Tax=Dictyostelium firmibasis TaxID=79012 RepID=A0AAN7UBU5_9MYCE
MQLNKDIFNSNTLIVSLLSLFSGILLGRFFQLKCLKDDKCSNGLTNNDTNKNNENNNQNNNNNNKNNEENGDNESDNESEEIDGEYDDYEIEYDEEIGDCKQVLVIRTDLGMTKGKIIAQCCHASLGARQKALKDTKKVLRQWENFGCAKITLKANSKEELVDLRNKAKEFGVVSYLVLDSGHTQIPSGSATVLAVGPAPKDMVDAVTKHLKLY